jgi:hypothetical protein
MNGRSANFPEHYKPKYDEHAVREDVPDGCVDAVDQPRPGSQVFGDADKAYHAGHEEHAAHDVDHLPA